MSRIPVTLWPSMAKALTEDFKYLVLNHERAVTSRKPSGRPVIFYPWSGQVRIEFLGTFDSAAEAVTRVKEQIAKKEMKAEASA